MHSKSSHFSLNPLTILIAIFEIFFTKQEENQNTQENNSSALTQERAKTVDEKDDKT
jgi:hypothetical protein